MNFRKAIAFFIAAGLTLTCFAGCGEKDSSSGSPAESQSAESEAEKTPETPEEWHDAMIKKAMYSYGNTTKMQEKIKKAQSGEDVTVVYLGGSITVLLQATATATQSLHMIILPKSSVQAITLSIAMPV